MKQKLLLSLLLSLFLYMSAFAQQRTVTGTVTDGESGEALPGVSVIQKGTDSGTATDVNGKYSISVPEGATLIFKGVGFGTREVEVGAQSIIDVKLLLDTKQLGEVVVVGYGTQERAEVTGSYSTIKGDELANFATVSFEQQLAGRAPGLQVTTVNGVLGAAPRVRIRGTNSISSGADPLYVVDNVPMITGNQSGSTPTNPLADINPSDIVSVEVLKDGSATAIYGSRAANGVILITTKRGQSGRMSVNYNTFVGFNSAVSRLDLLNAEQFVEIANEKLTNAGGIEEAFAGPNNVNTDWQDEIFRTGTIHNHALSFNGGTESTGYFFSLGYSNQQGALIANDLERYTFRSNLDHKVNKWIKIGTSLSFTQTTSNGLNTGENALSGNLVGAARLLPNVRVLNPDHPTGYNITPNGAALGQDNNLRPVDNNFTNIAYVLAENQLRARSRRVLGNAYADVTIIEGLTFRSQIGIDVLQTNSFTSLNPIHGDGRGSNGVVNQTNREVSLWNLQNTLAYSKTFGVHKIDAVVGMEYQKTDVSSFTASGSDFSDPFFIQNNLITGSAATQQIFGLYVPNGLESYFGRINYAIKDRYLFSVTIRRDGLSNLPEANRFGNFPGGSIGWRISEEDFLKNSNALSFISDLKVRASYAVVGNVNIGNFAYLGTFGAAQYGPLTGIEFAQAGNDQLKWEQSQKLDIGLDMGFWNDRVVLNFDYFVNDISDLVLGAPTAPSLGVPNNIINKNVGSMVNRGIELRIAGDAIRASSGFAWNVDFNITFIRNEIKSLNNAEDILFTYNINRVGEQIGAFYGFTWAGVNPANGNPMWLKGDGTTVQYNVIGNNYRLFNPEDPADISTASSLSATADRSVIGNSNPTWLGGITNTFRYKGVDLQIFARFSGGNDVMNVTRQATLLNMGFQNNGTEILQRWTTPGQVTNVPLVYLGREAAMNNTGAADTRFLESGDFLRIQNIVLGYTFPQTLLSKTGKANIRSLRIFAQIQNAFIFTGYSGLDPELNQSNITNSAFGIDNNTNPIIRTVSFGLNLGL